MDRKIIYNLISLGILFSTLLSLSRQERSSADVSLEEFEVGVSRISTELAPLHIIETSQHIELVGHFSGKAQSIVVVGDHAYAGVGSEFAILDISDPANITRIGWLIAPGEVLDIQIDAGVAYLAYRSGDYFETAGATGLQVVDIQDPLKPRSLATVELTHCAFYARLAARDGFAYLGLTACSAFGGIIQNAGAYLYKLDVSSPDLPLVLDTYSTPMSSVEGVATSGSWLYAIINDVSGSAMNVFDVSSIPDIEQTATKEVADGAQGIALSGDYAFIAAAEKGMQVIDISVPSNPAAMITLTLPGTAHEIFIAGTSAYVAADVSGMQIIDVTAPLTPSLTGVYATSGPCLDISASGNYAYAANGKHGLEGVLLDDLSQAGTYEMPETPNDIAVAGSFAFSAAADGFWVLEVANPNMTRAVAHLADNEPAISLDLNGDYAYVAFPGQGVRIIDISDPLMPSEAGMYDLAEDLRQVVVDGDMLYLAAGDAGFYILELSSPAVPVGRSVFLPPTAVIGAAIAGNTAHLALENGNLSVVDISIPSTPVLVGAYDPPDRYITGQIATSVVVQDNTVFLSTIEQPPTPLAGFWSGDVWLIDVTDPSAPIEIGSITGCAPYDIDAAHNLAVVACERSGMRLYEVSNPALPQEIGAMDVSEDIHHVSFAGAYTYSYHHSIFITEYATFSNQIFLPLVQQYQSNIE